jgi:hypothetical protein
MLVSPPGPTLFWRFTMRFIAFRWLATVLVLLAAGQVARAADRDPFDYEGQKQAGDDVTKIVFIADAGTHGPRGNHEFVGGSILLAEALHDAYPNVHAVIHSNKAWPKDLSHADAIIVLLNQADPAATDPQIFSAVRKGAGFMAIHYGVEVNKGEPGDHYLDWMGGYFEPFWSVNPWWTPKFAKFPDHPAARGVKPFEVNDEWYYHMRFADDMKGVTPILSDLPPLETAKEESSSHGGNPAVHAEVAKGQPQVVAWAYDRPDGGRGYGFTGMHLHKNLADDNFRKVLLNGVAWVSKLEVPEEGVPSETPSEEQLEKVLEQADAAIAAGK